MDLDKSYKELFLIEEKSNCSAKIGSEEIDNVWNRFMYNGAQINLKMKRI